jgi:probable F420-dependent oxidoreductase
VQHWLSLGFVRETDQLVALARMAEELGFHGVTLADHLLMPTRIRAPYPYSPDGKPFWPDDTPWPDPWVALAAIGAATTTLKLATNIYLMALRDPFTAARAIATAAVLSGDRVACGVAAGWLADEYAIAGVDFATRDARLDETIGVVRALLTGEPVTHAGEHFRFDEVRMRPAPRAAVSIWGGGASKAALRRVARLCDGWLGLVYTPEQLYPVLDRIRELRAEAGRADAPFDALVGLAVRPTPEVLAEVEARGVTGVISTPWLLVREDVSSLDAKRRILEKYAKHVIAAS